MRLLSGQLLAFVVVLALALPGCAKVGELKSMKAFKSANQAYQQQDYKKASQLYEEAIEAAPDTRPAQQSYFFLGNCYDNLYKPSKKGETDNDALLTKAVDNYQKAADKLNDPAKAEPVLIDMIKQEETDTTLYTQLAKLYEDAGAYDDAERVLLIAKTKHPDSGVYMQLAAYYNRQGQFDKTIDALEERAAKEPNNPEAFYTISTYYWDKAYRDFKLKENEKREFVQKGVQAVDHALQIKPDYMEALVYKNLLLRLEANLEKDPSKQQALIKQADQLRDKAQELRKQKAAGVSN